MEKIYKIQEKFVERDFDCPQAEYEMLKHCWKSAQKEIFDKFDKYACIKNDKWYLDLKQEKLGSDNKDTNKEVKR